MIVIYLDGALGEHRQTHVFNLQFYARYNYIFQTGRGISYLAIFTYCYV